MGFFDLQAEVHTIVRKSLIFPEAQAFGAGLAAISPGAYQPFVFVSLGLLGQEAPQENAARLPAVVDTGYGGVFCLRWEHLLGWVGWPAAVAQRLVVGTVMTGQKPEPEIRFRRRGIVVTIPGNLFLWDRRANPQTGAPESDPTRFRRLELDRGIDVLVPPAIARRFTEDRDLIAQIEARQLLPDPRPKCPLLGGRALREHHLRLTTSGHWFSIQHHNVIRQTIDRCSGFG